MPFGRQQRPAAPTPREVLRAKPVKLVSATIERRDDGSGRLTVPLKPNAFGRLFRLPAGATTNYELDALGLFVWDKVDGKTSVRRIAAGLAERWTLDAHAAEVATLTFLRTLSKRGLVGVEKVEKPA